jgi:cell wall-associated NlpC family hydrolase
VFIENMYLPAHNKLNVTNNIVDKRRPHPKPVSPVAPAAENTAVAQNEAPKQEYRKPGVYYIIKETPKKPTQAEIDSMDAAALVEEKASPSYTFTDVLGDNAPNNYSLLKFINKWYGSNYRLGGCDKSGIDCSGFSQKLYEEVYCTGLERTAKDQFKKAKHIKKLKDATEGDLVFFHVRSRRITHVGVYLANDYFVHASSSQGVVISNLKDQYWHKYYAGCGRIPKEGGSVSQ